MRTIFFSQLLQKSTMRRISVLLIVFSMQCLIRKANAPVIPARGSFQGAPKAWKKYVEAFIANDINRQQMKGKVEKCIPNCLIEWSPKKFLHHLESISSMYRRMSAHRNTESVSNYVESLCLCKGCRKLGCLRNKVFQIQETVGQFIVQEILQMLPPVGFFQNTSKILAERAQNKRWILSAPNKWNMENFFKDFPSRNQKIFKFYWTFLLWKELSVKIIFSLINVRISFQGVCSDFHHFLVLSFKRHSSQSDKFMFCGLVAPFTLYPPHQNIQLSFVCNQPYDFSKDDNLNVCWTLHEINASFSVIDSDLITSKPVHQKAGIMLQRERLVFPDKTSKAMYSVTMSKKNLIVFKLHSTPKCFCIIFDGPSSTLPVQHLHVSHEHKTKTFQAFMSVLCSKNELLFPNQSHLLSQVHFKKEGWQQKQYTGVAPTVL